MAGARKSKTTGKSVAKGTHFLVVEARFYDDIADALLKGAVRALEASGVTYDVITVPGSLEIPAAIAMALDAKGRRYDGVVALGCVIRGETIHFEIVSEQSARGLHGSCDCAQGAARQRHPHRQYRSAGLGARETGRSATRAAMPPEPRSPCSRSSAISPKAHGDERRRTRMQRKANRRGAARLAAVQALYQMDIAGTGLNDILAEFERHRLGNEVDGSQYLPAESAFFRDIVTGTVREQRKLDPLIDAALNEGWPLKRIEALLRAVLRAGAYELDQKHDIPVRVVISEYVDVANAFVDRDETGMVNAVLDMLARKLRGGELKPAAG